MTTMTFTSVDHHQYFVAPRSPKLSFAARLAVLQATHEQIPELGPLVRFVACGALALVPFTVLAAVFVTV